jgi:hypothetical protein
MAITSTNIRAIAPMMARIFERPWSLLDVTLKSGFFAGLYQS